MSSEWVMVIWIFIIGSLMFLAGRLSQYMPNGRSISWQLGIVPGQKYVVWSVVVCPHHVQYVGSWTEYFAVVRDTLGMYSPLLVMLPSLKDRPGVPKVKVGDIITIHREGSRWIMDEVKIPVSSEAPKS